MRPSSSCLKWRERCISSVRDWTESAAASALRKGRGRTHSRSCGRGGRGEKRKKGRSEQCCWWGLGRRAKGWRWEIQAYCGGDLQRLANDGGHSDGDVGVSEEGKRLPVFAV